MPQVINHLNPKLMKISVKTLAIITCCLLLSNLSQAQLKISTSSIGNDLRKVISEYPSRFRNLIGDIIAETPQSTDYRCIIKLDGAEESFFTKYSSKNEVYSWEAVMLTTESFEKAKQKFRSLFNQLNNLTVNLPDAGNIKLTGKYESPETEKKFTSVLFSLNPNEGRYAKMKVGILMEFQSPMEWKVIIQVYDQEREDDEQGIKVESR